MLHSAGQVYETQWTLWPSTKLGQSRVQDPYLINRWHWRAQSQLYTQLLRTQFILLIKLNKYLCT